ncbi:MAG: type II toxin-antitoxin system VapB family antitoxin [Acidobacteriota bacterium]
MPTNLAIDDELLEEALRVGGHRTKKATVTEALEEYIRRRRQAQILDLFGQNERAAELFNLCRRQGVQGSNTDFLLCAVAERHGLPILTTDGDFEIFSRHVPVSLHRPRLSGLKST